MKACGTNDACNLKAHRLETTRTFRALGRDHDTLQPLDESIIVGYALSTKCVIHYVLSGFQLLSTALCSIFSYSRFTFAGAVILTFPSKPKIQPKKGLLAVTSTLA